MDRRASGELAELFARQFLRKKGLQVLQHNWRCSFGEIDIVARDKQTLVICEVRSRCAQAQLSSGGSSVALQNCVDWRKQRQLCLLAEMYQRQHARQFDGCSRFDSIRIDVVLVMFNAKGSAMTELHHLPAAVEASR